MFNPPQSLVDAVRDRTLVPFIGAGVSVGAVHGLPAEQQFPDWNGLIRRLAARLEAESKAAVARQVEALIPTDAMAAAQLAMDDLGRPPFLQEMVSAFGRARPPAGADLSATKAIWRLRAPFLITTNYDLALEWPLDPLQIQRIHNDDPTYLGTLEQKDYPHRRIWHLHGSINRVDTLILTSDQYLKLYPAESAKRTEYQNAFDQFQRLLATRAFLFVGFSLAEPVLRKKLTDVLDKTARAAPLKYLLLRAGEADAAARKRFLDDYNVQVIEFANFGPPMIEAIDAIGRRAWEESTSVSGMGLTTEMEPLVEALLQQVAGLALPSQAVARIYNASKPDAWSPMPPGGDGIERLHEAIVLIGGAVTPARGGLPPLLDFMDRLAAEATEPWLTRLRTSLDDAIDKIGSDASERAHIRQLLARARASAAPTRAHVLVRIQPGPTDPSQWLVHAWAYVGTRIPEALFGAEGMQYKDGSSAEVVHDVVYELETRSLPHDGTSIAFIVPSLVACDPIHDWRLPESVASDPPIGVTYMVTVRSLERLRGDKLIRLRLKMAWNDFKARTAKTLTVVDSDTEPPADGEPALILDAATARRPDLASFLEQRRTRCVVLREPPCAAALDHLGAVLKTTAPVIVWGEDIAATPATEQVIRDLLQSGPIADLPRRIRAERAAAFATARRTGSGSSLSVIWDDADYLPPERDPNAKARLEIT